MFGSFRCAFAGALAGLLVGAPIAAADGLPLPIDGAANVGVTAPGGDSHYSTVDAGERTVVVRTDVGTGEIIRTETLRGEWSVPLVAYDQSASGVSADGETLILIRPRIRFPRATTEFTVLEGERLRVRDELVLRGDFSFDAISPDGRRMYLIRYLDPRDPTAYEVRAYDLERDRLLREPIVDEDVAPVTMGGFPQTRATDAEGRWAYTLYAPVGGGGHRVPFIHALDTKTGNAACIDLDPGLVNPRELYRMSLEPSADGSTLEVIDRGEPVASVDLETRAVTAPGSPAEADGGVALPWVGVGTVLALVAGGFAIRRRRSRDGIDEADLERLVRIDAEPNRKRERDPVR